MLLMLIKFFLVALAMALACAMSICIVITITERPRKIRQLRDEGYASCVDDILTYQHYWDQEKQEYVDIEITEVKTE